MSKIWHPYAQMQHATPNYHVTNATGVLLTLADGTTMVDGISSWWATIHGYNHPHINAAIQAQAGNFSHIMLGGLTHSPAQQLAQKLSELTPEGLEYTFFSDSGSVGVEVAVKIAIQYWLNQGIKGKHKMLSLTKAYHGDTFKAMEVGGDDDFHVTYKGILNRDFVLPAPQSTFANTDPQVLKQDILALEQMLQQNHQQIAGFILEPLVQCAGGFNMYSPAYLRAVRKLCSEYKVLLIFDEVATGFGRTGELFAANHAQISPDIMILGKALTAGYVGHAATIVQTFVFEGFYGEGYDTALMHGPTFMGNALACSIALAGIELVEQEGYLEKIKAIEQQLKTALLDIKSPFVANTRVLGAIGVIEMTDSQYAKGFVDFAKQRGVWLRPFGKYIYTMPPYIITAVELKKITEVMLAWLEHLE